MKKQLLLLLSLPSLAFAQTIPNGAFESWTTVTYDNPNYFYSANSDRAKETGMATVFKVTGSSGFAVRMETKSFESELVESYITTSEGDPRVGEGGYPYSQMPTSFTGKYRCNILPGDTGFIVAIFKKNGVIMGGSNALFTGNVSGFTSFSFPVLIGGTPDSVIIAASSSNLINEIGVKAGSWLELDELAFAGTGITQTILNGNFENWTSETETKLNNWVLNGDEGVSRVSDPFKGNYAVKLTTYLDPQDGLRQAAMRLSNEKDGNLISRGVPFNLIKDTLFGYYKLSTTAMDNSFIFARTFKNGEEVGWFGQVLTPSPSYNYFQIIMNSSMQPDSIDVVVESSQQSTMIAGTTLIIDEIQLKSSKLNTTGLSTNSPFKRTSFSVYPNPATEVLTLKTEMKGAIDLKIYATNGKEVLHQSLGSDQNKTLNIQTLEAGIYLILINAADGNQQFTKFIKN